MEVVVFPDAYRVVKTYLTAALAATGDTTTRVGTELDADERKQIIMTLVDTQVRQIVMQFSTIKFEAWVNNGALSQQNAQALGQLARGLLGAMQDTTQAGAQIYRVEDADFGLADSPDDKTGIERYVFHLTIAMRGTALALAPVFT